MDAARLTQHEDHALRRLHWFEGFGCELASSVRLLKSSLHARDRRDEVRPPVSELNRDAAAPQVTNDGYWIRFTG